MSKRPISVCSRGSASVGGSPTRRSSSASSSVSPSGAESCGGLGTSASAASRAASAAASSSSASLSAAFTRWSSSSSPGVGLPFSFVARGARRRADQRAPALVRVEQGVELLGGALPRERSAPGVRVAACSLEVDHEGSLRRDVRPERPGPTCRRPTRRTSRRPRDLLVGQSCLNGGIRRRPFVTCRRRLVVSSASRRRGSARRCPTSRRPRACGSRCSPMLRGRSPCRRRVALRGRSAAGLGRLGLRSSGSSPWSRSPWSPLRRLASPWSSS